MTRADYITLALAISTHADAYPAGHLARAVLAKLVADLADALERDNPRFNRQVFITECGFSHLL